MIKQYPHLETERDGNVLIIRLDNEAARNSLTREVRFSLRDVTREMQDDYSIRAVYLTGKGPTFCAGGDLRMLTESKDPTERHRRFRHAATFMPQLMTLDRPVVCGVRGVAIGGGMGLALMADSIVAGDSAKFMAGFFRLGVVPDCLTLFTLPRLIGLAKAREFFYSNTTWDAQQAFDNGIVSKVVSDDQLLVVAGKLDEEVGERLLDLKRPIEDRQVGRDQYLGALREEAADADRAEADGRLAHILRVLVVRAVRSLDQREFAHERGVVEQVGGDVAGDVEAVGDDLPNAAGFAKWIK